MGRRWWLVASLVMRLRVVAAAIIAAAPAVRCRELASTRLDTVSRERDRAELPAPLRRDVRLLGGLLGEVIRESGGQDLLDDVERLRHTVIAAREDPPQGGAADPVGDEIAALVAGWPLARAELVAK